MSNKLYKALAKRQAAAKAKGRLKEFLTIAAAQELLVWHIAPVLQVFVSDGQGGSIEKRVTIHELLRMEGGGKAIMERLAAMKALLELIGSAPENVGDTQSDSEDDIIMRILEKYDIKLIPPPTLNSAPHDDPS